MSWLMDEFPLVAARLAWHRCSGDRARARCPGPVHANGDRNPSLVLMRGRHGALIFKCLSGCDKPAILTALGLNWRDVCADRVWRGPMPTIVKTYDYRDADGKLVYQVCRYHPKEFRPRRLTPFEHGNEWVYGLLGGLYRRVESKDPKADPSGWKWVAAGGDYNAPAPGVLKLTPAEVVPYNLPFLLAAPPEKLIWFVEGEKDCDLLTGLGFLATTLPGGAERRYTDRAIWSVFRGRNLVVVPDHDKPGYQYAAWTAGMGALFGANSVTILRLPKLPPGGDVSDWAFRARTGPEDVGPDSTPAKALRNLVRKATGYRRIGVLDVFGKSKVKAARPPAEPVVTVGDLEP